MWSRLSTSRGAAVEKEGNDAVRNITGPTAQAALGEGAAAVTGAAAAKAAAADVVQAINKPLASQVVAKAEDTKIQAGLAAVATKSGAAPVVTKAVAAPPVKAGVDNDTMAQLKAVTAAAAAKESVLPKAEDVAAVAPVAAAAPAAGAQTKTGAAATAKVGAGFDPETEEKASAQSAAQMAADLDNFKAR